MFFVFYSNKFLDIVIVYFNDFKGIKLIYVLGINIKLKNGKLILEF